MKRTLIAVGALGAVLALILTSLVMGIGSDNNTEGHMEGTTPEEYTDQAFFEAWPSTLELDEEEETPTSYNFFEAWPSNTEEGPDEADEIAAYDEDADDTSSVSAAPKFSKLVNRGYEYLTRDFISEHSHWGRLPKVKTIFTANSSGEWMYKALPRINATGEARIIDQDGDGYPELVIWKHYRRNLTASAEQYNSSAKLIREYSNDADLSGFAVNVNRGFTLIYVDKDGDANPERISLDVIFKLLVHVDRDNIPELVHSFKWFGITRDRDDDGDQDVQRMNVTVKTVLNLKHDRFPEFIMHEKVRYSRMDTRGRQMWDRITAKVNKGMIIDPNSDGNPTIRKHMDLSGRWFDRDGDGWPQLLRISRKNCSYHDKDSDGNPEERNTTVISALLKDRNDDKYPELVLISYKNMKYFDRNSDGRVDMITIHTKIFKWIDRNSDGIPERVIRSETHETRYPQNDRPGTGIEPEKERPRPEQTEERPKDDTENRDTETVRPEQRPGETNEEEKEPETDTKEIEENRENNRQLSSRA
jgi:hypothetical protein